MKEAVTPPPVVSGLLTTAEAAAYLRMRPAALRLLVRKGLIGYYRPRRRMSFRSSDLEAYLASVYRPIRARRGSEAAIGV